MPARGPERGHGHGRARARTALMQRRAAPKRSGSKQNGGHAWSARRRRWVLKS